MNLAFGIRTDLMTLLDELEIIVDRPIARRFVQPRPGDVRHSQADNRQLRESFPTAAPHPLSAGLRTTTEWFQAHVPASERAEAAFAG